MTSMRVFLILAALLLSLAAIAACGGDDEETTTAEPAAAPTAPAVTGQEPTGGAISSDTSTAMAEPTAAPAMTDSGSGDAMAMVEPKVDRVVFAQRTPGTEGWDPNFDFSSPPSVQVRALYDYLVEINPTTGAFEPMLATEWSIEPNGLGIRYKLREGVQFHYDWGEFTAKDVEHTLWSMSREDSLHSSSGMFRTVVENLEIVNDHEVVFHLASANPNIPNAISQLQGGWEISSKDHYDSAGQPTLDEPPTAGTGPYQYQSREQGLQAVYERVPFDHWRINVDFPELELRWMDEASTRLASLIAGEVHIAPITADQEATAISNGMRMVQGNVPGFRTFFNFQGSWWTEHRNPESGRKFPDSPLLDQNVRAALSKAINREELNTAFFGGEAQKAHSAHFHPTRLGWNEAWEQNFGDKYDFDPAAARDLLAASGYNENNPLETNLHLINLTTYAGSEDLIESVQGYYQDIGVKANLVVLDAATRSAQARAHEFDNHIGLVSTSSDLLLAGRVYMSSQHPTAGNFQDPRINAEYEKAASTLDPVEQDTAMRTMGDLVYEVNQSIPLFWVPTKIAINPDIVSGYVFSGNISGNWTHYYNITATPK
ncbi:MAG: ABC transporter substrate-binding protein [Chloroflexota bacterium]|nr:ABC transporter substrate-binding protein [Chloroflexota bacterium]MDE2969991.1 ABC transporter substrate-binding protein [Chloroflexota bacterium]